MNQEKIGKFIGERRRAKKLTQAELAIKLGVTDKTISRWENGHYLPDVSLFNELCSVLDISVVELLNGEKSNKNIERKEVDETINKIVDISNKKINKNKKKIVIISSIIILLIIVVLSFFNFDNKIEEYVPPKKGDDVRFPTQVAIKEKDDGWLCYMTIDYFRSDMNNPYTYWYDCENYKYKKISEFAAHGSEVDSNGREIIYEVETNHPILSYNARYLVDLEEINHYFKENKFNKKITMNDLDGLKLEKISKEEVLELFNEAIESPKIVKWGNISLDSFRDYLVTSPTSFDNYTWYFGYYTVRGHIYYVNIELLIKDKYLSDLVKDNVATKEELEVYENIFYIKQYIIDNQKFQLPKELNEIKPYKYLNDIFDEIKKLS